MPALYQPDSQPQVIDTSSSTISTMFPQPPREATPTATPYIAQTLSLNHENETRIKELSEYKNIFRDLRSKSKIQNDLNGYDFYDKSLEYRDYNAPDMLYFKTNESTIQPK